MADPDLDNAKLALNGDVLAFERLYRRHCGAVHAAASRFFGAAEADDLTQDVFVRAWQKLATFRGEAPFGAWLRRLTTNLLANHFRRRQASTSAESEATAAPSAPIGLRLDLEAAIGTLPAGARAVFVLHDVEGRGHEEIATLLGVHVGTSKSQLHRARALLRVALEGGSA